VASRSTPERRLDTSAVKVVHTAHQQRAADGFPEVAVRTFDQAVLMRDTAIVRVGSCRWRKITSWSASYGWIAVMSAATIDRALHDGRESGGGRKRSLGFARSRDPAQRPDAQLPPGDAVSAAVG
jgi:hypothetical protein